VSWIVSVIAASGVVLTARLGEDDRVNVV